MIVSCLFPAKEKAEFDSKVLMLELEPGTLEAVQGERMQVGIRNVKGEIYRAIGVTGLDDFLHVMHYLDNLGLTDELVAQLAPSEGFDAIFSGLS